MKTEFKYCPNCKSEITRRKTKFVCTRCGMEVFRDSAPTASALILRDDRVLLSTRAIEPKKGVYDVIGGFLEPGEHPDAGVVREVKEETGLIVSVVDLIGVYMDEYEHQGRKSKTLNFYYVAEVLEGDMKPDDDVETLEWFEVKNLPKEMAFPSQKQLLKDLKEWCVLNKKS